MMPKIIPFKKEHLYKINLLFDMTSSGKESLGASKDVIGYTGMDGDVVLATGGVHPMWEGVGVARYTDMLFQHIQEEHKLFRIQASVSVLDLTANRYAQWLGFQKEGIMKKYGPDGTDYVRYARLM